MREDIHKRVTGDLRRIGLGAGLILLFIPIFILTVVVESLHRPFARVVEGRRREAPRG
jgi:hypothetical protein